MNIHKSRNNRIIIELSSAELLKYDLIPKDMDYESIKTKMMLNDILAEAQNELDRDITEYDKMLVDVMTPENGGCIIILSFKVSEKNVRANLKPARPGYLCEVLSPDSIFNLAESLKAHREKLSESRLYLSDNENYIVFLKPYAFFSDNIFKILCEFGRVKAATVSSSAYLTEHTKLLSDDFISSLTS